jgi:L-xylulokinase
MKTYLGIDNGGTFTKAALYTETGDELGVEAVFTQVLTPKPGWAERDMDEMRLSNYEVIRRLLEKTGISGSDVAGIACCGHGKGLYLWGSEDRPVRNGIISTDNRAWEYPERWIADGTADKVFKRTYQSILACQPVSLLAWLKEHEPDVTDRTRWIFQCKDFVRFCLTGEARAEMTDYSGSNLLNLSTRNYDSELLALFDLQEIFRKLPPLCLSTEICGKVNEMAAKLTGLSPGTPVMGGMFDIDACAVAVDAIEEERICMIAGTWSINEYIRKEPVIDGSVMMNSIFADNENFLIEECSPTSAGNLEWFLKNLLGEKRREMDSLGISIYEYTNEEVSNISVNEFIPLFLPFLMASNVHPNARAAFVGISQHHTRSHLIRSVYEGVVFSHRFHLERLMESRQSPPVSIRLAGGVINSDEWVQMFADILGYPIEAVDINEAGTLGCAMAVAVGVGDYSSYSHAAAHMITLRKAVEPDFFNVQVYSKRYAVYKKILEGLNPVWDSLQELA